MKNPLNPARIRQSVPRDAAWHTGPDVEWMLGATDLGTILGPRSVPSCRNRFSLFESEPVSGDI